jgi:hypothetical protein
MCSNFYVAFKACKYLGTIHLLQSAACVTGILLPSDNMPFNVYSAITKITERLSLKLLTAIVVFVFLVPTYLSAQVTLGGSKGTLHVYDAETIYPGQLYINSFYQTFATETSSGGFAEDHSLNFALTLGLFNSVEIFAHAVPYQDDQASVWGPPGNTSVGFKMYLPRKNRVFQTGFLSYARFPTANNYNVPFEPFTIDAPGWALLWISTWDFRSGSGTMPLKLSLNLGYNDLDWRNTFFEDIKDKLLIGLGLKFPIRSSLLYSEFTGEVFLNNTEKVAFTENYLIFTQGFRFLAPLNLVCDIAADFNFGGADDLKGVRPPFVKEYADWKLTFGLTYRGTLFRPLTEKQKVEKQKKQQEQNKLDEIRLKREQAIKDLEEMRKKIEEERTVEDP